MIYLTGSSGFVGCSLLKNFNEEVFSLWRRGDDFVFDCSSTVIHLAGKSHDLKKTSNPDEYYQVNTDLTKKVFDAFIDSDAKVFITLSSVKAVADEIQGALREQQTPNPKTHYGKSKLLAEQYILSKKIPNDKRVYILRPCMIHGPGNKGNFNLLYKFVSNGIPWPLGSFENERSFCSIDNLMFIIKELIKHEDIPSGVYNLADDEAISTNKLIEIIATTANKKIKIFSISKKLIFILALFGNVLRLPINSERLSKLTENYVVSNLKIKKALGIEKLPVSTQEGLVKTVQSFI